MAKGFIAERGMTKDSAEERVGRLHEFTRHLSPTANIDVKLIKEHPLNEELNGKSHNIDNLGKSLKEFGFHGVITVIEDKDENGVVKEPKTYTIVSGHQRFSQLVASKRTKVPCSILSSSLKEWQVIKFLIISNCGTSRGSGASDEYHLAKNIKMYQEVVLPNEKLDEYGNKIKGSTVERLGKVFGYSGASIKRILSVLDLYEPLQCLIRDRVVTSADLLGVKTLEVDKQKELYEELVKLINEENEVSSKEVRNLVRRIKGLDVEDVEEIEEQMIQTSVPVADEKADLEKVKKDFTKKNLEKTIKKFREYIDALRENNADYGKDNIELSEKLKTASAELRVFANELRDRK